MNAQPPSSAVAAFAADPASSAQARKFVREALDKVGVDSHVTDVAVLVASELVTNAVLHAHAGPILTVHVEDGFVRLEVEDNSELFPLLRNYGHEAVTGRGMSVVEATANRWGVETTQNGKTIWVEFSCDESKLDETIDGPPSRQESESIPAAVKSATAAQFPLLFRGVPVETYMAFEQQQEALLREFELILIGAQQGSLGDDPDLLDLITQVRPMLTTSLADLRPQLTAAREDKRTHFDITSVADEPTLAWLHKFRELMKKTDKYCDEGKFLTSPASSEVRALRDFLIDEVNRQYIDRLPPRVVPDLTSHL